MATNLDEDLRNYADSLPAIYKEILSAFPRIEPHRQAGFGLAFQTLAADFKNEAKGFSLAEIIAATGQLEQHQLATIKHGVFVHPTEYGERLIAVLTGQEPQPVNVPPLPSPPVWHE